MKPLSLANRVALLVALTAVILLGAAAIVMDHLVDAEMQRRFDSSLLVQAQALATLVEGVPDGLAMEAGGRSVDHPLVPSLTQTFAARCPDGRTLSQGSGAGAIPALMQAMHEPKQVLFKTVGTGKSRRRAVQIHFSLFDKNEMAAGAPSIVCRFVLMQPSAPLDDILLETDAILVAVPMIVLVLVLVLSPWLVRRGLKPLAMLREDMRDIGPQQTGQRLAASRVGEIEPLVRRFNEVLERMDEGVLRERRFAGAVAHETRTHLAELRTLLDVELRHPSPRPMIEVLGEISDISAELESTVSGLLLLTRLEAGIETLEPSTVKPARLVEDQLAHLRPGIENRQLEVVIDCSHPDMRLTTDRDLLKLVIANLVMNATAHAPVADRIDISITSDQLSIRNHAPDLDPDDLRHLGQRHWQKSHASDTHAGIGLSLAGAAARALGMGLGFSLEPSRVLVASLDWSAARQAAES